MDSNWIFNVSFTSPNMNSGSFENFTIMFSCENSTLNFSYNFTIRPYWIEYRVIRDLFEDLSFEEAYNFNVSVVAINNYGTSDVSPINSTPMFYAYPIRPVVSLSGWKNISATF